MIGGELEEALEVTAGAARVALAQPGVAAQAEGAGAVGVDGDGRAAVCDGAAELVVGAVELVAVRKMLPTFGTSH